MSIKLNFVYFILNTLLMTVPLFPLSVQAYEYPSDAREKFMRDCLTQPLPFGVEISNQDRLTYCNCLLNHLKNCYSFE